MREFSPMERIRERYPSGIANERGGGSGVGLRVVDPNGQRHGVGANNQPDLG